MKVDFLIEPVMRVDKKSDDIRTYGCHQVSLLFMLKPALDIPPIELQELVTAMMKAACDVIIEHNQKEDLANEGQPHSPQSEEHTME